VSGKDGGILVTGGAGFIGSNFILHSLALGHGPVVNLDKLTYAGNPALQRETTTPLCTGTFATRIWWGGCSLSSGRER